MFKDFELFSSQYTEFIDSGKNYCHDSSTSFRCNTQNFKNHQLQTQLSRKRQRFRKYRKNKKCSIFYELSEYQPKMATFFPLGWFFKNNIVYLDYFSKMKDERNGLPKSLSEDGVHPTLAGYKIMEPLADEAIKKAMKLATISFFIIVILINWDTILLLLYSKFYAFNHKRQQTGA